MSACEMAYVEVSMFYHSGGAARGADSGLAVKDDAVVEWNFMERLRPKSQRIM